MDLFSAMFFHYKWSQNTVITWRCTRFYLRCYLLLYSCYYFSLQQNCVAFTDNKIFFLKKWIFYFKLNKAPYNFLLMLTCLLINNVIITSWKEQITFNITFWHFRCMLISGVRAMYYGLYIDNSNIDYLLHSKLFFNKFLFYLIDAKL